MKLARFKVRKGGLTTLHSALSLNLCSRQTEVCISSKRDISCREALCYSIVSTGIQIDSAFHKIKRYSSSSRTQAVLKSNRAVEMPDIKETIELNDVEKKLFSDLLESSKQVRITVD